MICPILYASPEFATSPSYKCIEEECAWYDKKTKQCAILTIAKALKSGINVSVAR